MLFLYFLLILFFFYGALLLYYWQSWKAIPEFNAKKKGATKISVIIPARNEEKNIGKLLQALKTQSYPADLFEVIVIDDHSTDDTAAIVKKFESVKLISLAAEGINSYKKKAIETGIAASDGALIVTTDADCTPHTDWLQTISSFGEEKDAIFIAAPVALTPYYSSGKKGSKVIYLFQAMDFMMLQGITGASVFKKILSMCNGANLAYEKKGFYEVNGFSGIDHIASGDDMLLMHKIFLKYPEKIFYLKSKEAIMQTEAMHTWKDFFNQRIRWASKATGYDDKRIFWVLLLVWFFNFLLFSLFIAGFFIPVLWFWLLAFIVLKTIIELPLFGSLAAFFDKRQLIKYFLFFQPLHIFYTVIAGLFGQFGKYEWKGRSVR